MSGKVCFSKIGTNGAWSVQISNSFLGRPSVKIRVLAHAHGIASISNSIIAYRVSAEVRNRDPA